MISDTMENPCTGTISSLNSNTSMTSEGCLNIQVTSLISHPSLKNLDPILFGLQRIPSMLKVQVKGSNKPFDLNWNYEATDVNNKQPGNIERYLKVSFFTFSTIFQIPFLLFWFPVFSTHFKGLLKRGWKSCRAKRYVGTCT